LQRVRDDVPYSLDLLCYGTRDFFCESPFICKLYKYIQQMVQNY
jgi:hypothetical protein